MKPKATTPAHPSSSLARIRKSFPHVNHVVDATEDIDIKVTKVDTSSKAVRNHRECALAHACKRAMAADGAIINVTSAYVIKGDIATRYSLPESISREIVSFDREAGFEPGDYHLHTPPPSGKLGNPKRTGSRTYAKGNGKTVPAYHFTEGVRRVGDITE